MALVFAVFTACDSGSSSADPDLIAEVSNSSGDDENLSSSSVTDKGTSSGGSSRSSSSISGKNSSSSVNSGSDTSSSDEGSSVKSSSSSLMASNLNYGEMVPVDSATNADGVVEKFCYNDDP
ncbi:hypothetical protein [Fibrobacter sp.]|uniref:hypothetical protein n=1 Tax=Fibrobacter sp. TaxID=35828 RepID=UPI0025BFC64A|nr:hypothetical protein [Fibrobacter sp.]MBS7270812.1 hypothetical protein [Fibrobacter sp.]MCI6436742.1 hypothetical protein [Fibrobacter sp.]